MAKFKKLQASFVSGELAPSMHGRVDTDIYNKAAKKLENVYVQPQGGVLRREGLQYWDNTTSDQKARLVPFEFSTTQTYVLVFTPGEFKVYRTDVPGTVQDTVSSAPISNLTATQIAEMNWTQSADTLILFHNDFQPIKITRSSHTSWSASNLTLENIPPFAYGSISTSNPSGDINPDVTTGPVTVTGSQNSNSGNTTNFTSSLEGQFLNLPKGGRIFVEKVNSATELEGLVKIELVNTNKVLEGDWEKETGYEPVMSNSRGWAATGTFHKSRLWLGFVGERPQTVLASKVGDFFNLDVGEGLDDEGIDITLDDDRVNRIRNFFPGRSLHIFTSGGEWSIRSDINEVITPGNISGQLNKETLHGASDVRPQSVDGTTVFIEENGAIVRQFIFNEVEQSFNAPNISITSQHLFSNPKAMDIRRATSDRPADYLYVVNDDGTVAVLNRMREQELLAWSQFTTNGTIEDVAVSGRKAYFIVKRNIDNTDVRHLEQLNDDHFMDASTLQTSGTATTSWSGLDHLNGETVSVRGDDFILDDETVSSGSITSSEAVKKLEAGFFNASVVEPLPLFVFTSGQAQVGDWKSVQRILLQLQQSRNVVIDIDGQRQKPPFRSFGDDTLDEPVQNFSGWVQVFGGGIRRDSSIKFTQEAPLEFNVLSYEYSLRI